jgi:membrane-anchored mycosin MYCP
VRRGGPVFAACAAGLLLSAPTWASTAQAAPAWASTARASTARASTPHAVPGLPGPQPGCPPHQGIAAPASVPWPQEALRFAAVWDQTKGGGVTVAIIDSGVDANPQFGHRVTAGPDLAAADPAGTRRGVPRDADCLGHGTAVASIIAAAPVPGVEFTGVAPAARILSVKVSNTYSFPATVTPQAIRDAVALGASVVNLSLASPEDVPALRSAVEFALRHNVVVVAAAGNDTKQSGPGPYYPAAYPGVLAVGAVGPDGTLAGFSDRLTPVAVTAPGVNVTSAYPGVFPDAYDPVQNGTSFAAAFVSGVVALVRSAHPRLTAAQVVARIEATARGAAGPGTGHGLVDPVRAVTAVLPAELAGADTTAGASGPGRGGSRRSGQARHPGGVASAGPAARTVILAVIAGSFGLVIVVGTAVLAVSAARRRRPPGAHRTGGAGRL